MGQKLPAIYDDLTWQERRAVRNEYVRVQNGNCQHCGVALDAEPSKKLKINRSLFPKTFFDYPVHLHHDHSTGLTIGAVHNYCNAVLWQYHGNRHGHAHHQGT